jgi:hypothetical protein
MLDCVLLEKRRDDGLALTILRNREDGELIAELRLQPVERGHLLDAGDAPGRPEIDQHELVFEIGELFLRAVARRERERRRWQRRWQRGKLAEVLARGRSGGRLRHFLDAGGTQGQHQQRRTA